MQESQRLTRLVSLDLGHSRYRLSRNVESTGWLILIDYVCS